jgi:hypothetical protein
MAKGQAFLSEEEQTSQGPKRHLNIIISDADEEHNYLVVPVRHGMKVPCIRTRVVFSKQTAIHSSSINRG